MPAITERLPAKYLVKAEAPKIIASREQHEAYIQRLLDGEAFSLISSAEERLGSSWQSSGAAVLCFADVASPAPSSARPLD